MSLNSEWMKRLRSINQELGGDAQDVASVQLVEDARYRGSRERAPYAHMWGQPGFFPAAPAGLPGSGSHYFVEIRGSDPRGTPITILHAVHVSGAGYHLMGWADPLAVTAATRVPLIPQQKDSDPELSCDAYQGTFITANIPTSLFTTPAMLYEPSGTFFSMQLQKMAGLPFISSWKTGESFYIVGLDNLTFRYDVGWQAVRA